MGSCSQAGRGAARSVFEGVRGEGWACRRRLERTRQVGRGTELIWILFGCWLVRWFGEERGGE